MVQAYKFSDTARSECPDLLGSTTPQEFLKARYIRGCVFGLDHLMNNGRYHLYGWSFDFRPYLKRVLVKQYGGWQEYYAPNKAALRKCLYGRIQEMVEL